MTPEHEDELYALHRQAAELDLRAAELRLQTAQTEHRAVERHTPQPGLRFDLAGYETKGAAVQDHP